MNSADVAKLLIAHERYRDALMHLYDSMDISRTWAGEPRGLFCGLLVANLIGGVAMPPPGPTSPARCVTVLGPRGEEYSVSWISDEEGPMGSGLVHHPQPDQGLALVAFVDARPVAVHVVPAAMVEPAARVFSDPQFATGTWVITMASHIGLMTQEALAQAHGVTTYDLLAMLEEA